jgi:CRP-like cAMP-binding protein
MQPERNCEHCYSRPCIHKVPMFSSLDGESLMKIIRLIKHRSYKKGEKLISEGDMIDSLIIINSGSVKAFKYTADGREQILYVFSEGDFFGEQNLLDGRSTAYNIEALEPVKTCMLTKQEFHKLLYEYPDISVNIISELGRRITRMENTLGSMGIRNIDSRIAGFLLEYADGGDMIQLPLSREGMANYVGITRETMSRKLSQLENDGIIQSVSSKTIKIKDVQYLRSLAGIPE